MQSSNRKKYIYLMYNIYRKMGTKIYQKYSLYTRVNEYVCV